MAKPARRPSQLDHVPVTDRMRAACARTCEAFSSVTRQARSLSDELDAATNPGMVTAELHDEDSAVVVVREMITSLTPKTA